MRRFVYQHPRVYQYSGTKKKFCARRAFAPTSYVRQSSITYVVPEPLEAPYVPRKRTNSLNRERYANGCPGGRPEFSTEGILPTVVSSTLLPPRRVPYRLRRRRTWWWTGPLPSPGGLGGGGCTTETRPADLPKYCSEVEQPTGRFYRAAPSGPVRR